jgi:hypothetical protein
LSCPSSALYVVETFLSTGSSMWGQYTALGSCLDGPLGQGTFDPLFVVWIWRVDQWSIQPPTGKGVSVLSDAVIAVGDHHESLLGDGYILSILAKRRRDTPDSPSFTFTSIGLLWQFKTPAL